MAQASGLPHGTEPPTWVRHVAASEGWGPAARGRVVGCCLQEAEGGQAGCGWAASILAHSARWV